MGISYSDVDLDSDEHTVQIAALTPTDNGVIIGNGTAWTVESGSTFRASIGLAIGTDVQAYDADLAAWAGVNPSSYLTTAAAALAYQPLDADLTSWAGVTRASGFDAFAATPTSANLQALLSDESGSGALLFAGGALGTPASGVLTNCTGLPNASVVGLGTAALVNTGTSGATIPLLNGTPTFSGNVTFSGSLPILLSAATPRLDFYEMDAATDAKRWAVLADTEILYLQNRTDADAFSSIILSATRNGAINFGRSLTIGSPTGGDKGAGTLNCTAAYDDNVLLTDAVSQFAATGDWDRVRYKDHPVAKVMAAWWFDPDQYAEFWKANFYLPGMVTWDDPADKPSVGESITRLTAVVETQAALIEQLNQRLKAAGL